SAGPHTAHEIAAKLRGNSGHILVALRMLESIGWLDSDNDGRFTATPDFAKQALLPAEASKLYDLDMERYLRQGDGGALEPWIARIAGRWNLDEPLLADFLDSTVVVPVLATLSKLGLLRGSIAEALAALPPAVGEEVAALFATKGWLEGGRQPPVPTAPGRFFFERAMNLGVAASYRPMLAAIDQLLFGAAAEVFAHDADGAETHVDRSMNVLGSGFMHGRYFAEVEEILISIFGREPFADQPRYVADMGCG